MSGPPQPKIAALALIGLLCLTACQPDSFAEVTNNTQDTIILVQFGNNGDSLPIMSNKFPPGTTAKVAMGSDCISAGAQSTNGIMIKRFTLCPDDKVTVP